MLPRAIAAPDSRKSASRASNGVSGAIIPSATGASALGGNRIIQINQKHLSQAYENQSDADLGTGSRN
jgi:hypothetical protein